MRIGVVGSINMDITLFCERFPKKGETIKSKDIKFNDGGKGANQAVAIAKLGGDVVLFSKVGDDVTGKNLLKRLKQNNVNIDFVGKESNASSGHAIVTISENDNTIVVVPGSNDKVDIPYIDSIKNEILKCNYIIMQHEIPIKTNEYIIDFCYKNKIKTILNPSPITNIPISLIEKIDYIVLNEHEVNLLFNNNNTEDLLKKYQEKLIVTLGGKGVIICINDEIINIPCRKSNVVDTTGAGDTFCGSFVFALANDYNIINAIKFANISAGISTEKIGAQSGMSDFDTVIKEYNLL